MLDDSSPADDYTGAQLSLGSSHMSGPHGTFPVLDARQPQFSRAESEAALVQLVKKAGPASEAIARRVEESYLPIHAELHARAGGQASARVMLLAHHAQRTALALELATSTSLVFHGRFAEQGEDKGQTDKSLRNVVGIAAFATDLLNKAYAAATEEGKAKASQVGPVGQLMASLGVTPAGSEGSGQVPVSTGGVGSMSGPIPSNPTPFSKSDPQNPPSPKKPLKRKGEP